MSEGVSDLRPYMKNFRFKHETVLVYRRVVVAQLEKEIAEINSKARWFAGRLISIQEEIGRSEQHLVAARMKGDIQNQNSIMEYIQTLTCTWPEVEKAQKKACQKLLEVKKKMEEAIIQRKIIEKLKKRQYSAYLKQQEKEEEFQLDEFRSTHYS